MAERDELAIALFKELIGPRGGLNETLPGQQSPRDEYMCGVLEPVRAHRDAANIEAEATEMVQEIDAPSSDDDQNDFVATANTAFLSPALDPKALPRSIGLSFSIACDADPSLEVCATWARYVLDHQNWIRIPHHLLTGPIAAHLPETTFHSSDHVTIVVRSQSVGAGTWRISIYLLNNEMPADPERIDVPEMVFQPEIRVVASEGTRIVTVAATDQGLRLVADPRGALSDDASLNLQYRDRPALARGHLCGATWRDIDPQRPHPSISTPAEPPFQWIDGALLPQSERARFSNSDVRTDLLPMYPVEAPHMGWREEIGASPELDPARICELWAAPDMEAALLPVVNGYDAWLDGQKASVPTLPPGEQQIALENISQCERARDRMRAGIRRIVTDDDVRLAFCFANKAVSLQASWRATPGLAPMQWRPFQLAFILLNISAIADPLSSDRNLCDLLWFPTGGGKTEAYLGLTAFTLALRRRRAKRGDPAYGNSGAGVAVLSRYTLRLLTIQQFRRAMGVIAACEMLRTSGLQTRGASVGWRPQTCPNVESFVWGGIRFSAGLWVGGGVTPNRMWSLGPMPPPGGGRFVFYAGAIDILQGVGPRYQGHNQKLRGAANSRIEADGEPAQLTNCPCCSATLAVPDHGLDAGRHTLHFPFVATTPVRPAASTLSPPNSPFAVHQVRLVNHTSSTHTLTVDLDVAPNTSVSPTQLDDWWYRVVESTMSCQLLSASPRRPGYVIRTFDNTSTATRQSDFEIYCPNPGCDLNSHAWAEQVPLSRNDAAPRSGASPVSNSVPATVHSAALPGTPAMAWDTVFPPFARASQFISSRIPITAYTVDDQLYHRCPSVVIATVDKFARLAYEPKASALFGNVDHYHSRWGYYRQGCAPHHAPNDVFKPHPTGKTGGSLHVPVQDFRAPDLILQDELHLIEGPLGSMVGLYETAVEALCNGAPSARRSRPKYVASTATVRQAGPQVQSLFDRELAQFPPSAILATDRFFAYEQEVHPLDCQRPGRLYVGVCAPGRGAQTPVVRIWSALLQRAFELWQQNQNATTDQFFTLVGYFNAIRELAGAVALYRQDIRERMAFRWPGSARQLDDLGLELSGRTNSLDLPVLLGHLARAAPHSPNGVFSTSMFGTGVDVGRLGLMVVHGQPKTTASYIQASGRVGRNAGGLVVTFFRASRPRDLDHHEFFTGYHRAINRHVEPVTVSPFSPRARERGLGPLGVVLLRHAIELDRMAVHQDWRIQERLTGGLYYSEARRMAAHRHDPEVAAIPRILERRSQVQADGRRPPVDATRLEAISELDRWAAVAAPHNNPDRFVYYEYGFLRIPTREVVLGDSQHYSQGLNEVFRLAPQSLRDVEETTGFGI